MVNSEKLLASLTRFIVTDSVEWRSFGYTLIIMASPSFVKMIYSSPLTFLFSALKGQRKTAMAGSHDRSGRETLI
jgi:hypothetical protein